MRYKLLFLSCALAAIALHSCRKISFIDDASAKLSFSRDTVKFDTVFTSVGSATRSFKIYNTYNQNIRISSIKLAGGSNSIFRMNVDGVPGVEFTDIEIPPDDSLYVFVEVTIDPNAGALPFVVEDSVLFVTNNNIQQVQLVAWGQNAVFYDGVIVCDEVWNNDLPYVIYNSILVDSLCTLTINEGCRIYMHGNSSFYVLGTLKVLGTKDSIVQFEGDRLESFFDEIPGQWEGISLLRSSKDNAIKYASIKNSNYGLLVGLQSTNPDLNSYLGSATRPDLVLENTVIYDCALSGLLAVNAEMDVTNCLVYNTGENNVALASGGIYNFKHCTFANYGSAYLSHRSAVLSISDFISFGNAAVVNDLHQADFTNTIVFGNILEGNEINISNDGGAAVFNYNFNHSILRTDLTGPNFVECQINLDPHFENISERNYAPDSLSIAVNAGLDIGVTEDIDGAQRPYPGTLPDIGCYETHYVE